MKIRNGFVSNSSSSSFVLLGVNMSLTDEEKDILDDLDTKELEYEYGRDELSDYVIGLCPDYLDEIKTIIENKQIILDRINDYLNKDLSIKDIQWYMDQGYER